MGKHFATRPLIKLNTYGGIHCRLLWQRERGGDAQGFIPS
jgi:hypothetical protein